MRFEVGDKVVASRSYLMRRQYPMNQWRDLLDGPWTVTQSFRSRYAGQEYVQVYKGGKGIGIPSEFMEHWRG